MKKVIKKTKPKSFFEEIKMLNKKTKRDAKDAKTKSEVDGNELTRVANELRKRDNLTLDDIKDAIKNNPKLRQTDAKIIDTVLKCKMKEDKILMKDDTFTKTLTFYIVGQDIKTKYLTNDYLYLQMIANRFIFSNPENSVILSQLLRGSGLQSVTIISRNFTLNEDTAKGLIQDYDGAFSLICSQETKDSEAIDDIINNKPNLSSFDLGGQTYEYYGDEDACIIQVAGTKDSEVKERVSQMRFVHNQNSVFVKGEKKVTADGKTKFISKKVYPEVFCPSFWAAPEPIDCDFLFEFTLDYNVLFEYLEAKKGNQLAIPLNICYWDNIKYFFDFLGVFYLTARGLEEDQLKIIENYITSFKSIRDFCTAWKSQALNMERVFQDFINAFLNNSSFPRFTFLYEKAITVYKSIIELMKKPEYNNFCKVLENFKNFCYINNQLLRIKELVALLSSIAICLRKYCEGSNPDTLWRDITAIANKILLYLPNNVDERNALFPFICAEGGFNDGVSGSEGNAVAINLTRNLRKRIKEKEQKKKVLKSVVNVTSTILKDLKTYFVNRIRTEAPNLSSQMEESLVEALVDYFVTSKDVVKESEKLIEHVGTDSVKVGAKLEKFIDDLAKAFIEQTQNIPLKTKDNRIKEFIDNNEGRIAMFKSGFTLNSKKNKQTNVDKKDKKEDKKEEKKENDSEEEEEEEDDEADKKPK